MIDENAINLNLNMGAYAIALLDHSTSFNGQCSHPRPCFFRFETKLFNSDSFRIPGHFIGFLFFAVIGCAQASVTLSMTLYYGLNRVQFCSLLALSTVSW